jgi:hypothetical protein
MSSAPSVCKSSLLILKYLRSSAFICGLFYYVGGVFMEDLAKIITPDNFAMVVAVYLLIRFEKAIKTLGDEVGKSLASLEEKLESKLDCVEKAIGRNNRLLGIVLFGQGTKGLQAARDAEAQELVCTPANGEKKE